MHLHSHVKAFPTTLKCEQIGTYTLLPALVDNKAPFEAHTYTQQTFKGTENATEEFNGHDNACGDLRLLQTFGEDLGFSTVVGGGDTQHKSSQLAASEYSQHKDTHVLCWDFWMLRWHQKADLWAVLAAQLPEHPPGGQRGISPVYQGQPKSML